MTTIEARGAAFDIGRVVSATFSSVGRNATPFFLMGLGLVGLPQLILNYLESVMRQPGAAASPETAINNGLLVIAFAILSLILSTLLQAAVIRGVVEDLNGRKVNVADCLSAGLGVALPVIAISIMVGLGVGLGFLLLIVPGVMLAVRWGVAVPARVMERPGVFAAMGRSAELTKNHRWAIFAVGLVFFIVLVVISAVIGAIGGAIAVASGVSPTGVASSPPVILLTSLMAAVTSTIAAAGVATIYCELRAIKEGASPATLASVFD